MLKEAREIAKSLKRPCRIYAGPDRYVVRPCSRGPYEEPGFSLVETVGVS